MGREELEGLCKVVMYRHVYRAEPKELMVGPENLCPRAQSPTPTPAEGEGDSGGGRGRDKQTRP